MNLDAIAIGKKAPHDVNVVIEVPLGSTVKYEMDKEAGAIIVDRFLFTPMAYPGNYGFIPHTLSEDGDPTDVLVIGAEPLIPGCVINVRPVGALLMEDDGGKDEKIIAVPVNKLSLEYAHVENYSNLPEITLKKIEHFFAHYKDLEPGKWAKMHGWKDKAHALALVEAGIARAKK